LNYYNKMYNANIKLRKKDLFRYEISKCIPGLEDDEAEKRRNIIFSTPGYWTDLPIYPNAAKVVEWIYQNFNTYILTAPWVDYRDCVPEKYDWIKNHLPFFNLQKVIFCHDKHIIHDQGILIDDNVKHINMFQGKTVRYAYPYNAQAMSTHSADNWNQVLSIMKKMKKELDKNGRFTRR
jgi:5'-nucleotidase